jgi:hypothetical protein
MMIVAAARALWSKFVARCPAAMQSSMTIVRAHGGINIHTCLFVIS